MTTFNSQAAVLNPLAEEVLTGLSACPKSLSPKLFYDERGSNLFEQITERAIVEEYASEIAGQAGSNLTLIELGAGTASKTRLLLEAVARRQLRIDFYPIDVSGSALARAVSTLNGHIRNLCVHPILSDYCERVPIHGLPGRKLVLFIGSSIGNFESNETVLFLRRIHGSLRPGDALLVGFDMVKSAARLHAAYNDAKGITAEFNKNILARINREFGGQFDTETFQHVAFWNPEMSRIEMHLKSGVQQRVWIRDLRMTFEFSGGEHIHTENSYKFTRTSIIEMLQLGGFCPERTWTDSNQWFSTVLARV